ncbi:Receptor kinase-like protein Xa21, processed [Actinidia chinensis var. chinensis]|uniref:Receptor kinase-like protein Xa21, processed n=1 Tax=Actinidia chinensis var. chinensis TaxID=1590841 RepID=A0A2R6QHA2_ACTCC|nr:Receptor kinase-like protein Xa21, processed [Actinidia chinensis var. chinensis]
MGNFFGCHIAGFVHGWNQTDQLALLAFKDGKTSDPFGALNSWNESIHFCQWAGVKCGRRHQRVTLLTGKIPTELVHLSKLHEFISGNIPDALGQLTKLRVSYIRSEKVGREPSLRPRNLNLSESIPMSVSNATKIYHLSLSYNKFTGKVPPLERLSDLEVVAIARDHLVTREADGDDLSFLYSLTNASNLNILQLEENNFGGVLPESISNFSTSLFALYLQKNNIVGGIPTGVGNLVNLEIINLSGNQFTVGSVYKGTVDQGRKVVAVEVLNLQFHGASKSFIAV